MARCVGAACGNPVIPVAGECRGGRVENGAEFDQIDLQGGLLMWFRLLCHITGVYTRPGQEENV